MMIDVRCATTRSTKHNHELIISDIMSSWTARQLSPGYRRYKCGVQYIGTNYCGWAECTDHPRHNSIEGVLFAALTKFAGDHAQNFKGSSRTDQDVHALRNVFQVDLCRRKTAFPSCFTPDMIRSGLNYNIDRIRDDVVVTDVEEVNSDFDARGSAVARTYMYRILCANESTPGTMKNNLRFKRGGLFHKDRVWTLYDELDTAAMASSAQLLIGEKDFSSFRNSGCQSSTPFINVSHLQISNQRLHTTPVITMGGGGYNAAPQPLLALDEQMLMGGLSFICITIRADRFLLKMVRNIVGVLVEVGKGKLSVDDVGRILALRDRKQVRIPPAPANGLYLCNVHYD